MRKERENLQQFRSKSHTENLWPKDKMQQKNEKNKGKLKLKSRNNGKNIENPLLVFIMCVVLVFALAT